MNWANIKNQTVIALIQNSRWLVIFFLFVYTIGYIYKHAPSYVHQTKVVYAGRRYRFCTYDCDYGFVFLLGAKHLFVQ